MKIEEIRAMGDDVLQDSIQTRKKELLEVRCKVALGEEVHPHLIREYRRDIARMMTEKSQRAKAAASAAVGGRG